MPPEGVQDDAMARVSDIAAQAPVPEKPYSVKALQTLQKEFNETLDVFGGGELPPVEVDFGTEKKWMEPIPPALFVPLVAISEALKMVGEGEFAEKYDFEPLQMVSDVELRKTSAQLVRMRKDKKLIEAMQAPAEAPAGELGPPPEMGAMSPEDEELAAGLA
tara:strand:- start:1011 stop:1496 length:486 start_codon:yes stop_codon:yes gene_type:complete